MLFTAVSSGGAYLLASLKSDDPADPGRTFYITATYNRLLHAAEEFKVTKLLTEGQKAEFVYKDRHLFSGFHEENGSFLTSAEKQYLIKQCLNTVIVTDIESIPGVAKATIYKDRPVGEMELVFLEIWQKLLFDSIILLILPSSM